MNYVDRQAHSHDFFYKLYYLTRRGSMQSNAFMYQIQRATKLSRYTSSAGSAATRFRIQPERSQTPLRLLPRPLTMLSEQVCRHLSVPGIRPLRADSPAQGCLTPHRLLLTASGSRVSPRKSRRVPRITVAALQGGRSQLLYTTGLVFRPFYCSRRCD